MKIKRSWAIAGALWGCLILGLFLYGYADARVAAGFDVAFMLSVYFLTLFPWINRRLRRARGLPYKPSWWGRFVLDCDYERSVRAEVLSQGHVQDAITAAAKNTSAK